MASNASMTDEHSDSCHGEKILKKPTYLRLFSCLSTTSVDSNKTDITVLNSEPFVVQGGSSQVNAYNTDS